MPTFRIELRPEQAKTDGTIPVRIRVTHERRIKRLATGLFVKRDEVTKGGRIKNQIVVDAAEDIMRAYRRKVAELGFAVEGMSVEELCGVLQPGEKPEEIDFYAEAEAYITDIENQNTRERYKSAVANFRRFAGARVHIKDIRRKVMQSWIDGLTAAQAQNYVGCVRRILKQAARKYNDEDAGYEPVNLSFFQLLELPAYRSERKRAIPAEALRIMAELPLKMNKYGWPRKSNFNAARDLFLLSFCLIGTNAVDLHAMREYDGKAVTYQRSKTRRGRADHAEIRIEVPAQIADVFARWRERTGCRVLNLWRRWRDASALNASLSDGTKQLADEVAKVYAKRHKCKLSEAKKALNIEDLEFYAARHSWATIARNDCGIDKYTVHEALNHVDKNTSVTDVYIKKDFRAINEANRRVVDFVFEKKIR